MPIKMDTYSKYGIAKVPAPNSVNPDKNQTYKNLFRMIPASIKKYFDKDVKSYIYSLEGQVAKMCMPASDTK